MIFYQYFRLIFLMVLTASLNGTMLRLPCKTIADFDIFVIGKRLKSHVLMTFTGLKDFQCMIKCVENARCRSYNTNANDGGCEINGKALIDSGTSLTSDADWTYKSTDYNTTLVCFVSSLIR